MSSVTYEQPYPEAKLSAYYRDAGGAPHKIVTTIAIDPEGVTEEDVERLQHQIYIHLDMEDKSFTDPLLISIPGGKV